VVEYCVQVRRDWWYWPDQCKDSEEVLQVLYFLGLIWGREFLPFWLKMGVTRTEAYRFIYLKLKVAYVVLYACSKL
jgi:hypothetical protein